EMVPYASAWHDLAAVHEVEVCRERVAGQQRLARHITCAAMRSASCVFTRVCMPYSLCKRVSGQTHDSRIKEQACFVQFIPPRNLLLRQGSYRIGYLRCRNAGSISAISTR